ncbi:MAG: family 2 glycosyl transferase [Flavipsychrobacter sp.]|nr:family 2 glycosyl transferase [Flavipsychrobacter sp.]
MFKAFITAIKNTLSESQAQEEISAPPPTVAIQETFPPVATQIAGDRSCPVCNAVFEKFTPIDAGFLTMLENYGYNYPLDEIETFNFQEYSCPSCSASDRDRLYALYFNERTKTVNHEHKLNFIDFAPAPNLSAFFRKTAFLNYRTADLFMEGVDDVVDLTDMNIYTDSSFDIFLCSHILEHIEDDRKAMHELHRILKPNGWGITMVPIWTKGDHIIEDLPITTVEERWKYYGQDDHVRFYNRAGFVERLETAGFKVNQLGVDHFGTKVFKQHGIHPGSVLYTVEKKEK